jgi:hypothetical protein
MGDGIMALFGAPIAHEDHAVRACYAALRMQELVKAYSEEVRRAHGIEVQIRVGLNSGEVVVRSIGSDLHMDYTAVGQTTHLAARMEQLATPGSIRLTANTLGLAEGYMEVKPLGPVSVKGLAAPVEVYEAIGVSAVRSRLQAATARGLTRFVGRDPEVEQLRKALEQARAWHGQLVAIVGEPGVGKSRLFSEFTHSHLVKDWLILESGSVSYGQASSYLPVIDLLKAYFKVHDQAGQAQGLELLQSTVLQIDATPGFTWLRTRRLAQLGEASLLAGAVDAAIGCAAEALALSRQRRERGFEAWALRLHGEIALHGDVAGADFGVEAYVKAIALAEELGLRPLVAHCHLGLGKARGRTGKGQESREHLTTATTMYREMDMQFWREKAEAEMTEGR